MNVWLAVGATLSAIAALLHVAIIVGGPSWYRFFGAGERMAVAAQRGSGKPALITAGIALVLFGWSGYALAGAGAIPPLPLLPAALCAITAVYLVRGLVLVPAVLFAPRKVTPFLAWSSAICFGFGIVHLVGLVQDATAAG